MRILCVGGGPAGLFFSLLLKKARPAWEIRVIERHAADYSPGWGMVFSDRTLDSLYQADAGIHAELLDGVRHWDGIDIFFDGRQLSSAGHGFSGVGRQRLLEVLRRRAAALGVELHFGQAVGDITRCGAGYDLIVGADGLNSATREHYAEHFQPRMEHGGCRFIWLACAQRFDAFTYDFRCNEAGWFNLHAYSYDSLMSTLIIEAPEATWQRAGLGEMGLDESLRYCESLFAERLGGKPLQSRSRHVAAAKAWRQFKRLHCARWHHGKVVLLGDAAHSTHFSVGSGTKLAMEDGQTLARLLTTQEGGDLQEILSCYQAQRQSELGKLQSAARNRMEWFEQVACHAALPAEQFAYSLLTASQRIGHAQLVQRDAGHALAYQDWFAVRAGAAPGTPPMFTPFQLRQLRLKNRVIVSPMAMYSCDEGHPGDFLHMHLGRLALGGAALVMTEMTAVAADARITPGCAGLWNEQQAAAWQRIVDFAHRNGDTCIGLQLGHAGPKGSTQRGWEAADEPLTEGNWPLLAASAVAYGPRSAIPRAMTEDDMARVIDQFVAATGRAVQAGFDLLELHCAHGYLLSSFLSPLTNQRRDAYGGSIEGRCRFPAQVLEAVRSVWPPERPLSVRISAHDWAPGGNTVEDAVVMARRFKELGADLIDVSSGQTTLAAKPSYGRMYQTPFADRIRNQVGIATLAVGAITTPDQVNTIIAAGRADLCALGRPHLADPAWTLRAAAQLGYELPWPAPYRTARGQFQT